MPKVARVASILAFVVTGLAVVNALMGQIIILPFTLIPLIGGIQIWRRRVWGAYGLALFELAQLFILPFLLFRAGSLGGKVAELGLTAVLIVTLGLIFFFAGRSLAASRAPRGSAAPWIALFACSVILPVFVQAFVIPTGAMEDTLLIGDRILVQRFPQTRLKRGEMIVFIYPVDRRQTFIKRIVGIPGDRIRLAAKVVYRNGVAVEETYAIHKTDYVDTYRDNFPSVPNVRLTEPGQDMLDHHVVNGEVVVPDGKYFVLGDNRDNSLDSRYWGFVDASEVLGKPLLIYDSEESSTEGLTNQEPVGPHRVRWGRFFTRL